MKYMDKVIKTSHKNRDILKNDLLVDKPFAI